jgi:predicted glycoside hydrolase/deacetylase ChbG (UPF0249 family)
MQSFKYEASLVIPAKNASGHIEQTLSELFGYLSKKSLDIEVILVINNSTEDEALKTSNIASQFSPNHFKIIQSNGMGKGDAIKAGIKLSEGEYIGFMDADLPFELSIIEKSITLLKEGYALIAASRRDQYSKIEITSALMQNFIFREINSIFFNHLTSFLFNLKCGDTQAGLKFFNRSISKIVFSQSYCPRFLFDIELFLVCLFNNYKYALLPVKYSINHNESTVSLKKEMLETVKWLSIFFYRYRTNYYKELKTDSYNFTADDWGLTPSINQAILDLANKKIIKKVSIMSKSLFVNYYLKEIKQINNVSLGLHLNLTYNSLFHSPLNLLIALCNPLKRKKLKQDIQHEIEDQIQALLNLGINIEYIDGHHHVHIFPIVNNLVMNACVKYHIKNARLPYCNSNFFNTKIILNLFSMMAKRKMNENNIKFSKFYYPNYKILNSNKLKTKLRHRENHEIITHPSYFNDFKMFNIDDSYSSERVREYELLNEMFG